MILYLAILAVQVICIVDVIRRGRNQLWIMALMFVPVASTVAYLIVEVLPGMGSHRTVRTVRAKAAQALDPERELRDAHGALDLADTVANRLRVGDALAELGRWEEAVPLYRDATARGARDPRTAEKLARALFEADQPRDALALIETAPPFSTASDRDRLALLRARALDAVGRKDEAVALYRDLVTRVPGEEARCRFAALLLEQDANAEARQVLEEVEQRMRHLTRHQRAADASMYRWAADRLRELREA